MAGRRIVSYSIPITRARCERSVRRVEVAKFPGRSVTREARRRHNFAADPRRVASFAVAFVASTSTGCDRGEGGSPGFAGASFAATRHLGRIVVYIVA
jgi:hypothetical protein